MNSSTLLEAPALPEGRRFKVNVDDDGDVRIELQEKRTWSWRVLDYTYVLCRRVSAENIQRRMQMLIDRVEEKARRTQYDGFYPPRKIIGQGDSHVDDSE